MRLDNFRNWRFGYKVALLAFLSMATLSCSTPVVPERDQESYSSTWDAYISCVQQLTPYGRERECDQISSADGRGLSYDQYYGINYTDQRYPYQPESYPIYLYSLEKSTLEDMKARWLELSNEISEEAGTPPWLQE